MLVPEHSRKRGRLVTVRGGVLIAVLAAPLLIFQVGASDLDVYRHGGSALLHGQSLYSAGFANHLRSHLPFTYPPFAAVAAVLLLLIPHTLSAGLWAVATVVMFGWCVRTSFDGSVSSRWLPPDLSVAVAIALLLYTRPVFDHLGDGQVDILLMTMCLADTITPNPRWPRGLLVGIATAIKLVPGIFIPYLWITGRRRAAVVAAATFVLCEGTAAVAAFGDSHRYWTKLIFDTERPGYTAGYKNQSLRGIGLRLLPTPGRTFLLVVAAVVIAIVGLSRARRAASQGDAAAGAAITGLVGVLASPVSWIHAEVWVIPAIGILLYRPATRLRIGVAGAVTVGLLAGLPYVPNVIHGLPRAAVVLLQASFGLICLALVLTVPIRPRRLLSSDPTRP